MLATILPLFVLDVLTAFTVGMVPPLLPLLVDEWALSPLEAGLVNTVYAVGRLASTYPISRIRARWGTRLAVFLGIACLALGSVACGLAPGPGPFLLGRGVMGLGASAAFFAVFAELLEATPTAWRGRVANGFEGLAILSLGIGGVLAAQVAERFGWPVVFLGAGPVLLLTLGAWGFLDAAAGRHPPSRDTEARSPALAALRAQWRVYLVAFAMSAVWSGLFATLAPLIGGAVYGATSAELGLALGAGYVAELVGLVVVGLMIDRLPRAPVFLAGTATVAVGGLVLGLGVEPATFVAGLVLVGGGFAVWMIPATVLVDRTGVPVPPPELALFRIGMDVGMILGPLGLGAAADLAGLRVGVASAGLILVVSGVALPGRR